MYNTTKIYEESFNYIKLIILINKMDCFVIILLIMHIATHCGKRSHTRTHVW